MSHLAAGEHGHADAARERGEEALGLARVVAAEERHLAVGGEAITSVPRQDSAAPGYA
jgi:hypothetical protein